MAYSSLFFRSRFFLRRNIIKFAGACHYWYLLYFTMHSTLHRVIFVIFNHELLLASCPRGPQSSALEEDVVGPLTIFTLFHWSNHSFNPFVYLLKFAIIIFCQWQFCPIAHNVEFGRTLSWALSLHLWQGPWSICFANLINIIVIIVIIVVIKGISTVFWSFGNTIRNLWHDWIELYIEEEQKEQEESDRLCLFAPL